LITPNGRLAKLLAHPAIPYKQISCHFLTVELHHHQEKIVRNAKRSANDVIDDLLFLLKHITLYDETFILQEHWLEAERLSSGVDNFDTPYVALALQTGGWLWTGDKKLSVHLKAMGFERVLNTQELYERLGASEI